MSRRNTQDTLSKSPRHSAGRRIRRHRITEWEPEDTDAWAAGGHVIARRNLMWSTATMHVAFSIWSLWSVVVLFMPKDVYGLDAGDKLLLGAVATLVGGVMRAVYVSGTAKFGGRNWAVFSSLILLVPTVGTMWLLAEPGKPLWMYMVCAALTGFGGGNYAASLANVEAFYPQRLKGMALGITGGVGNLGVAAIQLVGLLVLSAFGNRQPYWVCGIYLVCIAVVGVGAALQMDNLDHGMEEVGTIRSVVKVPDSWAIALLYSAAFGSFIGFAFAFVQVLSVTFMETGQTHDQAALTAARIAFLGPLVGALTRIYGGKVADRRGGAPVTFIAFVGMIASAGLLVVASSYDDRHPDQVTTFAIVAYIVGFLALFALAGIGNGSVLKMIPSIFDDRSRELGLGETQRRNWARSHSGALIGFATAIGALGGVGIDLMLRQSYTSAGTETPAFWVFLVVYVAVAILTWVRYLRHQPPAVGVQPPGKPAVAHV